MFAFLGWKLSLVITATIPLLAIAGGIMAKSISEDASKGQGIFIIIMFIKSFIIFT